MTQEEIIEGNKLIAEFMGAKNNEHFSVLKFPSTFQNKAGISQHEDLLYHFSWDWLIPVVEKIGDTRTANKMFRIEIINGYTKIEGTGEKIFYNSSIEGSMLLATYKSVIQFITWYNANKIV